MLKIGERDKSYLEKGTICQIKGMWMVRQKELLLRLLARIKLQMCKVEQSNLSRHHRHDRLNRGTIQISKNRSQQFMALDQRLHALTQYSHVQFPIKADDGKHL